MNTFRIQPIGYVKVISEAESVSELVISEEFRDALEGVDDFSHLYVIYWMDRLDPSKSTLRAHPWGKENLPLVGVFATRTPYRPNPIGLTLVRLLERRGNVLRVKGLDALDNTPIVDIKPFDPWDVEEYVYVRVPEWWKRTRPETWSRWQRLMGSNK